MAKALAKQTGESVLDTALPILDLELSVLNASFTAFGKSWQFNDDAGLTESPITSIVPANWLVSPDGKKAVFI